MNAALFAALKHDGQMYGDKPYFYHLKAVASIISKMTSNFGNREIYETVAWLHDILEDTDCSKEELVKKFDEDIAFCVMLVTDPSGSDRHDKKKKLYERFVYFRQVLPSAARIAAIVKIADRLANVRESVKTDNQKKLNMYKNEHEDFRATFVYKGLTNSDTADLSKAIKELDDLLGYEQEN